MKKKNARWYAAQQRRVQRNKIAKRKLFRDGRFRTMWKRWQNGTWPVVPKPDPYDDYVWRIRHEFAIQSPMSILRVTGITS